MSLTLVDVGSSSYCATSQQLYTINELIFKMSNKLCGQDFERVELAINLELFLITFSPFY